MFKKIVSILDKNNISKLVGIFFLILGSSLLDLLGISIILPIVSLILDNGSNASSSIVLNVISKVFGTTNPDTLLTITVILIAVLFLIKAMYGMIYNYVMNKFSLNYGKRLTHKLMNTYLSMPYEYHLENNSSTLIRKSIYDVNYFIHTIDDLLNFLVKILTFIVIFAYLISVSLTITAITGALLIVFALLIILVLKPKTKKISEKVQKLNSNNYKFLSQAFLGIKESKISGTESNFSDIYDDNREEINKLMIVRGIFSSIPSNLIEFVGILGICISLLLLKNVLGTSNNTIIVTFAVFVYAVIKLLPIVISSTTIINNFSYYKTSVDTIYEDIEAAKSFVEENNNKDIKEIEFKSSIELDKVFFSYKSAPNKEIISNASLSIKKNSVVGIYGPSGGGKTTLIDILLGLLKPTSGSIKVDGEDITSNFNGWKKNISYIPQTIYLSDDTIRRNVAFGLKDEQIDDNKVKEALKKAQLDEFVNSLEKKEETLIGENGIRLSGGQRQRIGIARAFYRDTNIVVFDEATSALDYETEKQIFDHALKMKKDHTLIIVTHRKESIQNSDAIYKVDNNSIEKVK